MSFWWSRVSEGVNPFLGCHVLFLGLELLRKREHIIVEASVLSVLLEALGVRELDGIFFLNRRHVNPSRRGCSKGKDKEHAVILHIGEGLSSQAIGLEFDVVEQVNGAHAKSGSDPSSRKGNMEDVALGIHFFWREEFKGIAYSEIETEVAHFDSNG